MGLRRRARRDARRPQRRLPAAALRADEVPAPGACSSSPSSASTRCCTRPTPRRRTTAPASCSAGTRRSTRSRASRSARSRGRSATTSRRFVVPTAVSPATGCSTRRPRRSCSARPTGVEPLDEPAELQVLTTTGRTFIVSVGDLEGVRPGDVDTLPGYPVRSRVVRHARGDRGLRDPHLGRAGVRRAARRVIYDPDDRDDHRHRRPAVVYTRAGGAVRLARRRRADAGLHGQRRLRQLPRGAHRHASSAARSCASWSGRSPSPLMSVLFSFALGLGVAMVFNDKRMRGRTFYRSLLIIPYALPGFMMALVFRGLFNRTFGFNRWLGIDVGWLETPGAGDVLASSWSTCGWATRTCSSSRRAPCRASPPTSRRRPSSTAPQASRRSARSPCPCC